MRKTILITAILIFSGNLWAQDNIGENAFLKANQMNSFYNNKDFLNYVNCLLPQTYGNDPANKEQFVNLWKNITKDDTTKIQIIKVLKTSTINGQYQALILNKFHNHDSYIFGISDDKGKNWFFTTTYTDQVQFDQIIDVIPSIDTAFSIFVDPRFGKRITYNKGQLIASFSYTDINGNFLSSDSLKGKVIVLNFWSITCGPCIIEIPELNKLVEIMKDKEVVFIAPAIYTSRELLNNGFLLQHPFNYQIVLVDNDDYSVTSLPTHIIIDQDLKVVDRLTGYSPENIKNLEQIINRTLE